MSAALTWLRIAVAFAVIFGAWCILALVHELGRLFFGRVPLRPVIPARAAPAAARRSPWPLMTADDQPPSATVLRDDETHALADLAAYGPSHTMTRNGGLAADFLRERFPDLPDVQLGRLTLAVLWIMKETREACDHDNPRHQLAADSQALAGAALHLTALERLDAQ